VAVCKGLSFFSRCEAKFVSFFQELREQVEKLEAELEQYKKGAPPVTALTAYRGRTESWRGRVHRISWLDSTSFNTILN